MALNGSAYVHIETQRTQGTYLYIIYIIYICLHHDLIAMVYLYSD